MENTREVPVGQGQRRLIRHHGSGGATAPAPKRCVGDDGAAAIEFALVAPFLFLIVFGIIEFGYSFGQYLDVRHGAREGARLASINYKTTGSASGSTQTNQIISTTCQRMDLSTGGTVTLSFPNGTGTTGNGVTAERGRVVRVAVTRPLKQITGFLAFALNGKTMSSQADIRLEQGATFNAGSGSC